MKRRFVICVDNPTIEQQDKLTNHFDDHPNFGYWHWFRDTWLVVDPTNTYTALTMRDLIKKTIPGAYTMVFLVDDGTDWAGFGSKKMYDWMNETWPD